eukprot:11858921-Alexandrium_andersonii.AAC.1
MCIRDSPPSQPPLGSEPRPPSRLTLARPARSGGARPAPEGAVGPTGRAVAVPGALGQHGRL